MNFNDFVDDCIQTTNSSSTILEVPQNDFDVVAKKSKKEVKRWTEEEHNIFLKYIAINPPNKKSKKRKTKYFVKMSEFMQENGVNRDSQ